MPRTWRPINKRFSLIFFSFYRSLLFLVSIAGIFQLATDMRRRKFNISGRYWSHPFPIIARFARGYPTGLPSSTRILSDSPKILHNSYDSPLFLSLSLPMRLFLDCKYIEEQLLYLRAVGDSSRSVRDSSRSVGATIWPYLAILLDSGRSTANLI